MFVDMPPSYSHALVNVDGSAAEERYQEELVLRSISHIKRAIKLWRSVEANPSSTEEARQESRQFIVWCEREFGAQWRNVEALMERFKEK